MILLLIVAMIGCSNGGGPIAPNLDDTDVVLTPSIDSKTNASVEPDRFVLSLGVLNFSEDHSQVEVVPIREAAFHLNVLGWLEQQPGLDFFNIVAVSWSDHDSLLVNIRITHPFPYNLGLACRDMRLIMITPASKIFPATLTPDLHGNPSPIYASRTILNPDGYSTLWNRWTSEEVLHPMIFGYIRGKFATHDEYFIEGNLHPFREYHSDDLNRVFLPNQNVTKQFDFKVVPGPFSVAYSVDCSWDVPTKIPPKDAFLDFTLSANCPEPYQISATVTANTLTKIGGSATVQFDVFDWQDTSDFKHIQVEAPDLFFGKIDIDPNSHIMSPTLDSRRYEVIIPNAKGSALTTNGGSDLLVAVEDALNSTINPDLTAYNIFKLPVMDQPGFWRDRDGDGSWVNTPLLSPYLTPSTLSTGQPDIAVFSYPEGAAQLFGPDPELLMFDDVNTRFIAWNRTINSTQIRAGYPQAQPPSWLLYPHAMDCNNPGWAGVASTSSVGDGNYKIKHAINMFTPFGLYGYSWSSGTWKPGDPNAFLETIRDVTAGMGNVYGDPVYGLFAYESGALPTVGHVINVSSPYVQPVTPNVFRADIPLGNVGGIPGEIFYGAERLKFGIDTEASDINQLPHNWYAVYIVESNPTTANSEMEGFKINFSNLPSEFFWNLTDFDIKSEFPGGYAVDCEVVPAFTNHVTLVDITKAEFNWLCVLMTDDLSYWLAFYDPLNPSPDNPTNDPLLPIYVSNSVPLDLPSGMKAVAMDVDHQFFEVFVLLRDASDKYYLTPFEFFY